MLVATAHQHILTRAILLWNLLKLWNGFDSIPDIDGITISGGEPFEQAAALVDIIGQMKRVRPELTVFIFSGHEYQTLLQSEEKSVRELIQHSDMLSTGPYIAKLRDSSTSLARFKQSGVALYHSAVRPQHGRDVVRGFANRRVLDSQ